MGIQPVLISVLTIEENLEALINLIFSFNCLQLQLSDNYVDITSLEVRFLDILFLNFLTPLVTSGQFIIAHFATCAVLGRDLVLTSFIA